MKPHTPRLRAPSGIIEHYQRLMHSLSDVAPVGRWAPGSYIGGSCHDCGRRLYDTSQNATQCLACAVAELKRKVGDETPYAKTDR